MPLLGTLITGLFQILLGFFGRFLVLEKAFKLAMIGAMLVLAAGLYTAFRSCVDGICGSGIASMSSSHPTFAVGLGAAFNSTTYAAASCYISVWTVCQMYIIKKRMINLFVG